MSTPQFHFPASPSSIITVIIIVASAVTISATIYLLLRFLSNRLFHSPSFSISIHDVVSPTAAASSTRLILNSLPLFSFRSVTGNVAGGGHCAVCLSKFDPDDRLRLLPLCCHVFHADCIDVWIVSNQTCPLCRSTVLPCGADPLDKIMFSSDHLIDRGGSFRIEIGSVSRGRGGDENRRAYSLGSFEYVVHENDRCEVLVDCTSHRQREVFDDIKFEILAEEISSGRRWMRECVERISSAATSFRSSGRTFETAIIVPEEQCERQ